MAISEAAVENISSLVKMTISNSIKYIDFATELTQRRTRFGVVTTLVRQQGHTSSFSDIVVQCA